MNEGFKNFECLLIHGLGKGIDVEYCIDVGMQEKKDPTPPSINTFWGEDLPLK